MDYGENRKDHASFWQNLNGKNWNKKGQFVATLFMKLPALALLVLCLASSASSAFANFAVLTQHNNLAHTGQNLEETTLTTANVNTNTFGLLFTRPVDEQIYAQPLIMTNVNVPGQGVHNLLIVATVNDTVYAFDADDPTVTAPYWTNTFINPPTVVPPNNADMSAIGACGGNYVDFSGKLGIVGTPVIDPVAGTIYVVVRTKESGTTFVQRLHALDVTTGQDKPGSPVVITATYPGSGDGNVAGTITFDAQRQNQRCGLSLVNGVIYIAWSSHCDLGPYHGWVLGYDATTLARVVVYNDTPNGGLGGIWMSGEGISADPAGNLYFATGNGTVGNSNNRSDLTNRADSILKLTRSGSKLTVSSWFTPYNFQDLENGDIDMNSSGIMLIPGTTLAVGGGKQGIAYLVNRDNMGGLSSSTTANTNIIQSFAVSSDQIHGTMVWWDGPTASYGYIWPASVFLQQYKFDRTTNQFVMPVFAQSPTAAPGGQPGGILALSANGSTAGSGIIWASHQLTGDANHNVLPGILHAYDAANVNHELWNSQQNSSRDSVGNFAKFVPPTVANGKVYLATFSGRVDIYGNASGWVAQPAIIPNSGTFSTSVTVTITNATAGATMYYTTDGSTPTTSSMLYTGPFVITNSTVIRAYGTKAGFVDSSVAVATLLNSSAVGTGTGLKGSYYSNQAKTFNDPATLVRTDAVVNFNWGNGSPDPSISVDTFTVRWTGTVQPPLGDTYTFYTTTDDGVRLWVNNQLIIDNWVDEAPTEKSGSITLTAQQKYNLRMEYYEDAGGAEATLSWSTPSLSKVIVPQTQLYPATNLPPVVTLLAPTNNSTYTASASVTLSARATNAFNTLANVNFYNGTTLLGTVANNTGGVSNTFTFTATGLSAGSYALKAVVTDLTGLTATSAVVNITVNAGSGLQYGLTNRQLSPAFFNMPQSYSGTLPPLLSQTGIFTNTAVMGPSPALVPYTVNVPLWSDTAVKTRYFAVPNNGAPYTPDEQITFSPTGEWAFPAGTVFVKTFELITNEIEGDKRRLETRLIVRDTNGAVYGVTYKWRPDNSDADLLTGSSNEDITITTATGTRTQTWYYPSPSDCLVCHVAAANYVLGVKTRQLNGNFTYPSTAQTDNQLRTLNRMGLLNPAIDEAAIAGYSKLSSVTNPAISLEERARSYLDANCAQCHRPGGSGPTFDARYDTPLVSQNITNAAVSKGNLGYDNAKVVVPKDLYRSIMWDRMNNTNSLVKMAPLARNLVDSNAVQVVGDWINSLPGTPALMPPIIMPNGGTFVSFAHLAVEPPDTNATLYYTLDGSLPTAASTPYTGPFTLSSNATVSVNAFETGYNNSVAATAVFMIRPPVYFTSSGHFDNQQFIVPVSGIAGKTYVLQTTTNLVDWTSLGTNVASADAFSMTNTGTASIPYRFYRVVEQGP